MGASAARLGLEVLLELPPVGIRRVVLLPRQHGLRYERLALDGVPRRRHGDPDPVEDRVDALGLLLGLDPVRQQGVASRVADLHDALLAEARDLEQGDVGRLEYVFDQDSAVRLEVLELADVDLVDDDEVGLVGEQRLDRPVELALRLDGVAALLREVHEVEDARA